MARTVAQQRTKAAALPEWVAPQLTRLVDAALDGDQYLSEIKYDGYRMRARLDRGAVKLRTRTGLDWTHKYPSIAKAVAALDARQAYLDGELCGVGPDGITSFNIVQLASESGNAAALVFFLFDLLHLDGEDLRERPPIERKERLRTLLANPAASLHYSDHVVGQGPRKPARCIAGIVSKRIDAPYAPGNRGLWRKVKCLNRAEFVVVGWTDPEEGRPYLGALLPAYYDPDGKLIDAGRVGIGIDTAELEHLRRRLQPLATARMPLTVPAPRGSRFPSACSAACIGCVRRSSSRSSFSPGPADSLLREDVYEGLREDKPTTEVRREDAASEIWRQEKPATGLSCADRGATTFGLMVSGHCQPEVLMPKARRSGILVTSTNVPLILAMVARGDRRHDIGAWFGLNQGRIKEVEDGDYGSPAPAPANQLPPSGSPGPKALELRRAAARIEQILAQGGQNAVIEAIRVLREAMTRFDRME